MSEVYYEDFIEAMNASNLKLSEQDSDSFEPLYLKFDSSSRQKLNSKSFAISTGVEVILDFDEQDKLVGIEFY